MKQRHYNDERVIMTLSLMTFLSDTGHSCTWEKGECPVRVANLINDFTERAEMEKPG